MELELTPEQPRAVAEAVASVLGGPEPAPDPWWQAGIDEALTPTLYGAATARPRRTRGAARA